eukprot:TRINITY_DN1605_c0_g1_i1.p1 TRINITY_DN1605_c0_g1~~TRINITY_DN1605_c0_g1_i1.p1  ORF type:complete len:120 (-),score=45.21 TRINITY_DN1605_c0_g1_i1:245-604(-)
MFAKIAGSLPRRANSTLSTPKSTFTSSPSKVVSGSLPSFSVATASPIGMSSINSNSFNAGGSAPPPPLFSTSSSSSSSSQGNSSFSTAMPISNVPAAVVGAGLSSFLLAILSIFLDPDR